MCFRSKALVWKRFVATIYTDTQEFKKERKAHIFYVWVTCAYAYIHTHIDTLASRE